MALPALHWNVTLEEVNVEPGGGFSITAAPVGVGVGVGVGVPLGVAVGVGLAVGVAVGVGVLVGVEVGVGVGLVEEMTPTSLCVSTVSVTLTLIGDEGAEL